MPINYSFTQSTIKIQCGGETLEVPLPYNGQMPADASGGGAKDTPSINVTNTQNPLRPKIRPVVMGILTKDGKGLDMRLLPLPNNLDKVILLNDVESLSQVNLLQKIHNFRHQVLSEQSDLSILDVGVHLGVLPSETDLSIIQAVFREESQLYGIRFLMIPEE